MTKEYTLIKRAKDKVITIEEARNSIYIDFEGVGRSPVDPVPMPHMLGSFRPKTNQHKAEYRAYLLKPLWKPVANGSRGQAKIGELKIVIESLIEQTKARGGYLVYFSDHERNVIHRHCPELYESFESASFNVYPPLKRMFNRQNVHQDDANRPDSLAGFMVHYFPASQWNATIKLTKGAADSCRKIDGYASKNIRWGNWKDKHKVVAHELLAYNQGDCRSTWKLTKKLANHQT